MTVATQTMIKNEEPKAVADALARLADIEQNLDTTTAELKQERENAAQAVVDGKGVDQANKKVLTLTLRLETLKDAAVMAAARIDQARQAEQDKARARAQKKIDALRADAQKELDAMKSNLTLALTSFEAIREIEKRARQARGDTDASTIIFARGEWGMEFSANLRIIEEQGASLTIKLK